MHPALQSLLDGVRPVGLAKNAAAAGAGAVAAKAGGAIAKRAVASIEHFANESVLHEGIVEAGAGLAIDAGLLTGLYIWQGAEVTKRAAKLMVIGTGLAAFGPVIAPHLAEYIEKFVDFIMGLFGKKATASSSSAPPTKNVNPPPPARTVGPTHLAPALPQQTIDMSIGTPGGSLYGLVPPGGSLYHLTSGM